MQPNPSTTDLRAALSKTLHSAAFGKFMTQAIAQAIKETAAKPQGLVLLPAGRERHLSMRSSRSTGKLHYELTDDAGYELSMIKSYEQTVDSWGYRWHPAHWQVHEERKDERGNTWRAFLGEFVIDDFGDLVEVVQ